MGHVKRRPVLLVTGTLREAALVDDKGIRSMAGGSDPARLVRELRAAAADAAGIVSFGMAGALDPGLRLGDVVIGSRLIGAFPRDCDRGWAEALRAMVPGARVGVVHADGRLFVAAEQKAGPEALAVDMESHLAGAIAAEVGVPFAVLRCISDISAVGLPPAIAVAMAPGGGVAYGAVIGSILRQPGQLPHLARTVRDFGKAYGRFGVALRRVEGRLGFDHR